MSVIEVELVNFCHLAKWSYKLSVTSNQWGVARIEDPRRVTSVEGREQRVE